VPQTIVSSLPAGVPGKASGACEIEDMNFNNSESDNDQSHLGISSPANQSLRQSLYIAALDRYLGIRGLISPVHDKKNDLHYDFLIEHSQRLIKVFKSVEAEEIAKYAEANADTDPIFIIDTELLGETWRAGCEKLPMDIESEEIVEAAINAGALLYHQERLWQPSPDEDTENSWEPLEPFERSRCINALLSLKE
jgi:hypothetical protein